MRKVIKVPLWFDDYCVTWSPAERILRHISSIPCRPVRACSFFSPLQLLRGAAGGGLLRLLLAAAGAAAHAAGGGQRRALHNAAENMVGGEGAGESVCLRGRSTDPCLRGAQRSLIKKVFKSKCNKPPFPCITRMTGEKAHAQYADDNRICAGRGAA